VRRHGLLDVERFDDGMRRPSPQRKLDALDRFLVAFNQRFDAPIREIFRVAVNPFGGRARSSEHPEADALHTSANENPPGDDHKRPL
jgi:hypothetical protein